MSIIRVFFVLHLAELVDTWRLMHDDALEENSIL